MGAYRTAGGDPAAARSLFVVHVKLREDYPNVAGLSDRARAAAAALRAGGTAVRFIRTVYVPEDGMCLLVFATRDSGAAQAAAVAAGLDVADMRAAATVEQAELPGRPAPSTPAHRGPASR